MRQERKEQLLWAAGLLRGQAATIEGRVASLMNIASFACEHCGTQRYERFTQKVLYDRMMGAAERLTEIAARLERAALNDDDQFEGPQ